VHGDVMLEAATTSFQIPLQVPAADSARLYNASLVASAPVLAAGVNSPFAFGKLLWAETRIPLFEQAVAVHIAGANPADRRVTFGGDYLAAHTAPLFEENRARFVVLLPMLMPDPPRALAHLRLHNGTIWRWNRPLVGFDPDGTPHVRIEHRVLPAGPSIIDMIANAAFYTGLAGFLMRREPPPEDGITCASARAGFYAAARYGLDATIAWIHRPQVNARELILSELLTRAAEGLHGFGVDKTDAERYLGIVEARVRTRRTGAAWQCAHVAAHGRDWARLCAAYLANQRSGAPVHEWPI
jgi:hypothetical protein